ncbi:MAG TPA: hypothetical protein VFY81_09310 [Gammaproteobacteria bacterium]|nr:hypothetical protein [Gammaproteobacteria bacterium]
MYRVLLRGENFLLNLTGEPQLLGFRVVHYIKAGAEEEAAHIATIFVRKNQHLSRALLNPPENPTRLVCESVQRVWWRRSSEDGRYSYWLMEASDEMGGDAPR